jgi:hypothetical protein
MGSSGGSGAGPGPAGTEGWTARVRPATRLSLLLGRARSVLDGAPAGTGKQVLSSTTCQCLRTGLRATGGTGR